MLSIDRITIVLPFRGLSESEDIPLFEGEERETLFERLSRFSSLVMSMGIVARDLGATSNYYGHFELRDGVNFQFCPKRQNRKLKERVVLHGPTLPKQRAPLTINVYEYLDKNTSLRFEWNPNRVQPQEMRELIYFLAKAFDCFSFKDIEINRLDVAIDYAVPLKPQLFISDHDHYSTVGKRSKGLQTVYLGQSRSSHQYRIYNKKDEIFEKTGKWIDQEHFWRLELQINDKLKPSEKVKNYFDKLKYISDNHYFLDQLVDHEKKPISLDDKSLLRLLIDYCSQAEKPLPEAMGDYFSYLKSTDRKMRKFKSFFKQLSSFNVDSPSKIFDDQFDIAYKNVLSNIEECFISLPDVKDFNLDSNATIEEIFENQCSVDELIDLNNIGDLSLC